MTTIKHTTLPWVVELNPTIPEGIQVAAFVANGEMAGNRHLQVIVRSHNPDADANLIVDAVNNHEALQAENEALRALIEALEQGFPLLDDEGLDEVEHHCEWVIQRERKRAHSILATYHKRDEK